MAAKQPIGAPGLHREIGAIQATALVAGGTIGTSIFIIPSAVAQSAGTPVSALAIWVAAGLLALIASLCLAELSSVIPQAGGTYAFLKRAYPFPVIPFSFAWMMCFAYGPGAMAVVATMSAGFVSPYLKAALHLAHDPARPVALAMLLGAGVVNAFGVRIGGAAQTLLTVVKVALLVSLIAAAFIVLSPSLEGLFAATAAPGQKSLSLTSVTSALMLCMFSYSGSHFVTLVGGEVRNPERVIPLAIFLGAAIVMTLRAGRGVQEDIVRTHGRRPGSGRSRLRRSGCVRVRRGGFERPVPWLSPHPVFACTGRSFLPRRGPGPPANGVAHRRDRDLHDRGHDLCVQRLLF